jgi:hypothetical protein
VVVVVGEGVAAAVAAVAVAEVAGEVVGEEEVAEEVAVERERRKERKGQLQTMTHSASSADQNGERPTHRPRMRPLNRQATSRIARLSLSSNSLSLMVLVDGDISSGSAAILPSGPSHSCQLSKCKCTWELVDRVARSWPHQSHSHAVRVSHTDTCNRVRHVPGVLKRVFCSGTCVLPLTQRHDAVIRALSAASWSRGTMPVAAQSQSGTCVWACMRSCWMWSRVANRGRECHSSLACLHQVARFGLCTADCSFRARNATIRAVHQLLAHSHHPPTRSHARARPPGHHLRSLHASPARASQPTHQRVW